MNISTQEVGHVFAVSALRGSSSPHSFGPGLGRSYFQVEYSQHDGWQCNSVAIFHYHRVVHVSSGEGRFNGGGRSAAPTGDFTSTLIILYLRNLQPEYVVR